MNFNIYRLQVRTLSHLFLLLVITLVGRFKARTTSIMTNKLMLTLCILPTMSIFIMQKFAIHVVEITDIITVNEAIPMISIIAVNIFVFILVENLIVQNEKNQALLIIREQNIAQQKHIKQLLTTHDQIRQMSHDFKQQADILYRLCKDRHYDELLTHLSQLSNHRNALLIVKTGNIMLDTILSSKKDEADKQTINFKLTLNVQPDLYYMSIDICILLGNAIDNAIEACMMSAKKDRVIEMDLTADSSRFLLRMKNTVGEKPHLIGEFLQTKKSDRLRHGVGLQSIKQISKNLGGDMSYKYDEEYFSIWIYIPVKELEYMKNDK